MSQVGPGSHARAMASVDRAVRVGGPLRSDPPQSWQFFYATWIGLVIGGVYLRFRSWACAC